MLNGRISPQLLILHFIEIEFNMEKEYQITSQGSLGLLALGHVGIRKWREVVEKEKLEIRNSSKENVKKNKK